MHLVPYGWRSKKELGFLRGEGEIDGHFSEERNGGGKVGWKCEEWLDRSLASNQEKAGNESWGVLALLLFCSLLSLCSLLSALPIK